MFISLNITVSIHLLNIDPISSLPWSIHDIYTSLHSPTVWARQRYRLKCGIWRQSSTTLCMAVPSFMSTTRGSGHTLITSYWLWDWRASCLCIKEQRRYVELFKTQTQIDADLIFRSWQSTRTHSLRMLQWEWWKKLSHSIWRWQAKESSRVSVSRPTRKKTLLLSLPLTHQHTATGRGSERPKQKWFEYTISLILHTTQTRYSIILKGFRYYNKRFAVLIIHFMAQVQATEEERAAIWQEVWTCRKALAVEHKMLQEPPEKTNFLTTTLRR